MPAAPPVPRRLLVLGIDYEDPEEGQEEADEEEEEERSRPITIEIGSETDWPSQGFATSCSLTNERPVLLLLHFDSCKRYRAKY